VLHLIHATLAHPQNMSGARTFRGARVPAMKALTCQGNFKRRPISSQAVFVSCQSGAPFQTSADAPLVLRVCRSHTNTKAIHSCQNSYQPPVSLILLASPSAFLISAEHLASLPACTPLSPAPIFTRSKCSHISKWSPSPTCSCGGFLSAPQHGEGSSWPSTGGVFQAHPNTFPSSVPQTRSGRGVGGGA
jgi:hypothetical protein